MNTYDVHITLSPAEEKLDYIKVCTFRYIETELFNVKKGLFRFAGHLRVWKMRNKLSSINVKVWRQNDRIEL